MPTPWPPGTDRLQLVEVEAEHIDLFVALDSDPEVMRFISGGEPNSRERYEQELMPRMMAYRTKPYGFLTAFERGRFVGWFHLRPSVADPTILEVGYRLRRPAWGRGLATEGSRALVRYAFEQLEMPAVDACADPRNEASIRVMIKCGMHRVGTFIHPRAPIEVVRYLVEREDPR